MNIDYKNKIISKTYLIVLSLITVAVLIVGTAFGRYLTQSEHRVGFLAEKPTNIYLNQSQLLNKTHFQPQMTQVDGKITSIFTLSNYELQANPEAKEVKFYIRAFVARQEGYLPVEGAPGVQLSLSDDVNNVLYSSTAEKVNTKTDFYKTNEKYGEYFRFYETQQQDSEKIYALEGDSNREITFTLIAKDIDFSVDALFVYVELVK